jgi:hypothetical protein
MSFTTVVPGSAFAEAVHQELLSHGGLVGVILGLIISVAMGLQGIATAQEPAGVARGYRIPHRQLRSRALDVHANLVIDFVPDALGPRTTT